MYSKAAFVLGVLIAFKNLHFTSSLVINQSESLLYSHLIIDKYTKSGYFTREEFRTFYDRLQLKDAVTNEETNLPSAGASHWCAAILANVSCTEKCKGHKDVFNMYAAESRLNPVALTRALPAIIIAHEIDYCQTHGVLSAGLEAGHRQQPPRELVWGYGIGFVVLVCLVSNLGGFLTPLTRSRFFQKLLMFLVSIAVGTLAATGLIVLIPEALDLMSIEVVADDYIWKTSTVLGGILFFYLSERLMKMGFTSRKLKKCEMLKEKPMEESELVQVTQEVTDNNMGHTHIPTGTDNNGDEAQGEVRTVAWMMLFGDGLHKFVDGLSIGAAYSQSIRTGLTLSIAILCEEIPHELGDVAILLHSGMTMKKALVCNTLSAAVVLVGLTSGIFLGEVKSASQWIFAVAAGIFLYVPLVDMLPEMSYAADKAIKEGNSAWWITTIQLLGLCLGFVIILIVVVYAGDTTEIFTNVWH